VLCWFVQIASGHADGSIRLWDAETGACEATLHGHRSAASALRFGPSGAVLASGSKDCDVILWDVVAQAGLFRLRGHRDQVRYGSKLSDSILWRSPKMLMWINHSR
jgi:WD40 repeat protein